MIKTSEHSTIQIVMFDEKRVKGVLKDLEELGCSWEGMDDQRTLAVDIPPAINYADVQKYLSKMLAENVFDYKEACLSETHRANT